MNRHEEELRATAEQLLSGDLSDVFATGRDADVTLPGPNTEVMVATSVKIPLALHQRIKTVAEQQGVGVSTLLRQWAEVGLTAAENDQQISLAQLQRAIAHIAQSGHAA
ncbi:MAG TPA: hypothetical protein VFZ32_14065 [Micromonosporaceae bacterium]